MSEENGSGSHLKIIKQNDSLESNLPHAVSS